jgi:hypothetical protein
MTGYETFLFAAIAGFEILLCGLVYYRKLYRRLPLFTAYATAMPVCSVVLAAVFLHSGFRSWPSVYASWYAIAVTSLARTGAIAELCRKSLKAYQGIWALIWRFLIAITAIFFVHAAIDARGLPNWFTASGMTVERDVEIASAIVLVSLLLIGKYYGLAIDPLHKLLGLGIVLFCTVEFVNNSVVHDLLMHYGTAWTITKPLAERATEVWNTVQALAADASIGIWCYALRKPLAALNESPALLPVGIYDELSPAINLRLRAFNARLVEMLKP